MKLGNKVDSSSPLLLKGLGHGSAALASLGASQKCEILSPATELLSRNLHFYKGPDTPYTLRPVLPQTPGERLGQKPKLGMCESKACALPLTPHYPSSTIFMGSAFLLSTLQLEAASWKKAGGTWQVSISSQGLKQLPPGEWTFHLCSPSLPVCRRMISSGKVQSSFHPISCCPESSDEDR